jgi:hypothetical protein
MLSENQIEPTMVMTKKAPGSFQAPSISLTPIRAAASNAPGTIKIVVSRLLAYDQRDGFTRLKLTGGQAIDVKESTEQIDLLVRAASSGFSL